MDRRAANAKESRTGPSPPPRSTSADCQGGVPHAAVDVAPWGGIPSAATARSRTAVVARASAGLALILLITAAARWGLGVNAATVGFFFLLVVLGIAATGGRHEAIAVSLGAVLCFNYFFLPPVGRFTIADPQNWVALCALLAT